MEDLAHPTFLATPGPPFLLVTMVNCHFLKEADLYNLKSAPQEMPPTLREHSWFSAALYAQRAILNPLALWQHLLLHWALWKHNSPFSYNENTVKLDANHRIRCVSVHLAYFILQPNLYDCFQLVKLP